MAASLLLAAALATASAAHASDAEKERAEAPEAAAVSHAGIRYQAPPFTRAEGLPHNGGYVEAVDEASGRRRWIVEVVPPLPDDGMEQDKREVFITQLKLMRGNRHLLVVDERGRQYRLDLRSLCARRLAGP